MGTNNRPLGRGGLTQLAHRKRRYCCCGDTRQARGMIVKTRLGDTTRPHQAQTAANTQKNTQKNTKLPSPPVSTVNHL